MNSPAKVLIQGIGNPLRSDDALGPMLIERLEASKLAGNQSTVQVELEWVYQLQIENAELARSQKSLIKRLFVLSQAQKSSALC
jgi:Ni,Fe-hydrogenase maturation factor